MFKKNRRQKYVIFSSHPYQHGGPLVLFFLCELLVKKGFDAKVFLTNDLNIKQPTDSVFWKNWARTIIPYWFNYILFKFFHRFDFVRAKKQFKYHSVNNINVPIKYTPFLRKGSIVVYPEVVGGNPLKAEKVVRWLLHAPGYHTGEISYGDNDLFFCYTPLHNSLIFNPKERLLSLVYFDQSLWKQTNFGERVEKCYIIRKGSQRKDLPSEFDGIIIDTLTDSEIAIIFNKSKYCISYDTATFYMAAAVLCGCIAVVIPEENIPVVSIQNGVAKGFSDEEINKALASRDLLIAKYYNISKNNDQMVDSFIKECSEFWRKN